MSATPRGKARASRLRTVRPPRLARGSRIGIAAPASAFDREELRRGCRVLEAMGFRVELPGGLFSVHGAFAGEDAHRARLLEQLFRDPEIDAVLCARGGWGSLRILPLIDYGTIARHPKALIGFSDTTALLSAVAARTGLVVFHGPMAAGLAEAGGRTRAGFRRALCSGEPLSFRFRRRDVLRPGRAAGRLAGGNLTTLCHLVGTPFAPSFEKAILFLEDRGEAPYRIDRMLTQMRLAGLLSGVRGVVLGSFRDCGPAEEIGRIVLEALGGRSLPVAAGLAAGHGEPNLTLPLGAAATLDTGTLRLVVEPGTDATRAGRS
ncbi:MAG: LD-carboxypeptidase [Desulfobacterales bacterium]